MGPGSGHWKVWWLDENDNKLTFKGKQFNIYPSSTLCKICIDLCNNDISPQRVSTFEGTTQWNEFKSFQPKKSRKHISWESSNRFALLAETDNDKVCVDSGVTTSIVPNTSKLTNDSSHQMTLEYIPVKMVLWWLAQREIWISTSHQKHEWFIKWTSINHYYQ